MIDYFTAATALQRHEMNVIRQYRAHAADQLRAEADQYDLKALTADASDQKELEWIAFGLRIAAVRVEP